MKRTLCLALCLLLAFALSSCSAPQKLEDFKYKELEDGTISITDYKGNASSIVIPDSIDGKTVSRIGSSCFSLDKVVSSIVLPETVTIIESNAFASAQKLNSVTIKAKNVTIESNAFSGAKLSEVKFEGEVIHIKGSAFSLCTQLKALSITNAKEIIIDGSAFASVRAVKSVTLSADTIKIGKDVFSGSDSMTDLKINAVEVELGEDAFVLCTKLANVLIDNKDEKVALKKVTIGNSCFSCCDLTSFKITGGEVVMGDEVFNNNGHLTEIHVPKSTYFGKDIFTMCFKNPQIIYE